MVIIRIIARIIVAALLSMPGIGDVWMDCVLNTAVWPAGVSVMQKRRDLLKVKAQDRSGERSVKPRLRKLSAVPARNTGDASCRAKAETGRQ